MRVSRPALLVALAAALVTPAAAHGSILVAEGATSPTLKVDAAGNAEVGYRLDGVRRTLLVPPTGRYLPNGRISGPDVSEKADATIPFKKVVRVTTDGRTYALQLWRPKPGEPTQLRLSRWLGDPPTAIELAVECCTSTGQQRITGRALLAGKPVFGTTTTTAGTRQKIFVQLECLGCDGAKPTAFQPLISVAPRRPDGTFALLVRPEWESSLYRALMFGPNRGTTLAPDALMVAAPPPPAES